MPCLIPSRRPWHLGCIALGLALLGPERPAGAQASPSAALRSPRAGSPERRALLDAIRRELRTTAVFKVAHMAIATGHAFVRAGEVVPDGDALQETDLFVEVLLVQRGGTWRVVELWNLQKEPDGPRHEAFLARVRRRMAAAKVPTALLPDDLRTGTP